MDGINDKLIQIFIFQYKSLLNILKKLLVSKFSIYFQYNRNSIIDNNSHVLKKFQGSINLKENTYILGKCVTCILRVPLVKS